MDLGRAALPAEPPAGRTARWPVRHEAKLFTVGGVSAKGDAVVAQLTDRHGGDVTQAVEQDDFPLFWGP